MGKKLKIDGDADSQSRPGHMAFERTDYRSQIGEEEYSEWRSLLEAKRHSLQESSARDTEMLIRMTERDVGGLQNIEDALERLDRGTYGLCERCHAPISRKRLILIPEVRYCMECEQDIELEQRLSSSQRGEDFTKVGAGEQVSDIMTEKPVAVRGGESVEDAWRLMFEYSIRHLPVVDSDGEVIGIVSDRDLNAITSKMNRIMISEVMTKVPVTVEADTSLEEAGAIMIDNKFSCLPVVENNRLIAILTEGDFVRLVVARAASQH